MGRFSTRVIVRAGGWAYVSVPGPAPPQEVELRRVSADQKLQHPSTETPRPPNSLPRNLHGPLWTRGAMVSLLFCGFAVPTFAQDNYEIQVYGSDTVAPHQIMVELHSNFTVEGSKTEVDGVLPTNHAFHETLEITRGFTPWFEAGLYIFTSARSGDGWQWVGDHIRPRIRAPEEWHWPVNASLSAEFGYQRRAFSANTWTLEIRPIVDKKLGRWYFSLNPTRDRSFQGRETQKGFVFSPNFKVSYDITEKVRGGFEYYGSLGPVTGFDPVHEQQHQFMPSLDLNLSPDWEINFGVGIGATASTDHLLVKLILGYRFKL